MAKGDPTSARNLKIDQLPRVRPERAEPGSAQLSAEGLPTLSQRRWEPQRRPEDGAQGPRKMTTLGRPVRAGPRGQRLPAEEAHTLSQWRWEYNHTAYQTHHAQEPAEGDSARSAAAPEAQSRLKNCAESTT